MSWDGGNHATAGAAAGAGFPEERAEGLRLVTLLDLLDIAQVAGIEQLRPEKYVSKLRLETDDIPDSRRRLSPPARAGHKEGAAVIAVDPRTEVRHVERIEVDQLGGIITVRLNLRHGDDDRLCPQVHPKERVRRVGVWRDNELVAGVATLARLAIVLKVARKS